ncbi:MAG: hypothetical protein A3C35_02880 [Omnitrophica bacterium RIFCSPHIGHO2_02_FULL_46_11]|nr:MAG: hypothetical protein A3C35_02880 [Omnitrophica bacterium RIFCSPHIGHO2_02_FULL_46_11]OGW84865.1 MAG: hypothetical protein A3A81_00910 [Omnitrophica bacterium RIFCSPLOWO2_01_FULL_45_10b]
MKLVETSELSEREVLGLFKGWFNNKMTIILVKSQYPKLGQKHANVDGCICFLHDLEHHFLNQEMGAKKKSFLSSVCWLKAFFRVYPSKITALRSKKALEKIKAIYDAFGFPMFWNNQGARLKDILSRNGNNGTKEDPPSENKGAQAYKMKSLYEAREITVLHRALMSVRRLLSRSNQSIQADEIHKAKSLLYAALERLGTKTEKLFSVQRMIRELFSIVMSSCDSEEREKKIGLQILDDIEQRYLCENQVFEKK